MIQNRDFSQNPCFFKDNKEYMTLNYAAACLFGLEGMVGREIDDLGYKRTETLDGRVYFEGDESAAARFNINTRFAERLYLLLGRFDAPSFDALFEGTKALCWEKYIGRDDAFPVKGHSIKSALYSIPDCQKIVKKAVVERLKSRYRLERFPETGKKYQIEFFILNDSAALMLDLSGEPLHKRGYRKEGGMAPLRETTAAAIASLARPREDVLFWDPFCGSGTIAIEAALMMTGTAPGLNRNFAAESWPFFGKELFSRAREEAKAAIKKETAFECFASDIDPDCIELAKENIKRAGVSDIVKPFVMDALKIETGGRRGTIVCNPPYGERLWTEERARELYRDMGKHFSTLGRWQIYILTSCEEFESYYGRRADKVRPVWNGMLKCGYYQYFKNPEIKNTEKR
jgi:putative N6-adenine-specific DNA methylase